MNYGSGMFPTGSGFSAGGFGVPGLNPAALGDNSLAIGLGGSGFGYDLQGDVGFFAPGMSSAGYQNYRGRTPANPINRRYWGDDVPVNHGGRGFRDRPSVSTRAPRSGSSSSRSDETFIEGKLFIGGLSRETTTDSLTDYCSQWGELSDAVAMEMRGFGFVTFADPANARAFLDEREHIIDGRRIEAKAAVPKTVGLEHPTKKVFVGGTGDLGDEEFREYFAQFGEITDSAIVRNPETGKTRGFGFVTFSDEVVVEKLLVSSHEIMGQKVELKRAVPRDAMGDGRAGRGFAAPGRGYGRGGQSGRGVQRFRPY